MPTTLITGDFTVFDDETYTFGGHVFTYQTSLDVTFLNLGRIIATNSSPTVGQAAIAFYAWPSGAGVIDNRGEVSATDTGYAGAAAWGLYAPSWGPDVINSGTWSVEADGMALGLETWSPSAQVTNSGMWTVSGGTLAYGMYFANPATIVNSGDIIANSANGRAYAIYCFDLDENSRITNSGTISATAGLASFGIMVSGRDLRGSPTSANIINEGVITADVAIESFHNGGSPPPVKIEWVLNAGTINGAINLWLGDDIIDNRNAINGDVHMGEGSDVVDTTLGVINGVVYLGAGGNTLRGGAGVDVAGYLVASTAATWTRNSDGSFRVTADNGNDRLYDVEVLQFTDRNVYLDSAARDFSGDRSSDILFRRADGVMASWDVSGTSIASAASLPTAGAEWSALGAGDFNSDGRADVLWQRSDGLVYTWHMNGAAAPQASAITGISADWSFLGVGDFGGDGRDDIAWQRNDGIVFIWQMDGAAIGAANAVTGVPAAWEVAGVGDFSSDGRDDFLWRNSSSGQTVIWQMNGSTIQSPGPTSEQASLDWAVLGVGDTNGDGRDDVILQRASDGMIQIWAMDGTNVMSATDVNAADPAQWTVRGIGDYNGDGCDDILWQHDNGLVYVWLMNGAAIQSAGALAGIGPEWGII